MPEEEGGLHQVIDRFDRVNLLVIGESVLDVWMWGAPRGLSREGPVPVVSVVTQAESPGAAGNAAVGAAALGARTRLLSVSGDDDPGVRLRRLLGERGVPTDGVLVESGRATVTKRRICSGDHLHLRCDSGDETAPAAATARRLLAKVGALLPSADAVLVCDRGTGLFTPQLFERIREDRRTSQRPPVLVVDARVPRRWALAGPDVVTPNSDEVRLLLPPAALDSFEADRVRAVHDHGHDILAAAGAHAAAVTLDADGVVLVRHGHPPLHLPTNRAPNERAAGAGDTFAATLTICLAGGAGCEEATRIAAAAASVVVRDAGISRCTAADLRVRILGRRGSVEPPDRLAGIVAACRRAGRRVVFTNGCFDVLHSGHVAYLSAAREAGDVLVVAVNSDASVRRLKGPDRPINGLADRLAVLAALDCVDHLVVFDADTPAELLVDLRPDVYVKGGDYTESMLTEAPLVRSMGGEVRIVGYVEDRSTSRLVRRIRDGGVAS